MLAVVSLVISLLTIVAPVSCQNRTTPPPGAVVVRPSNAGSGEFTSVGSAINSLPNDKTAQIVFIFPGTYSGQVNISRKGPVTLFGYTTNVQDFNSNQVVLTHAASLATSSSDDLTGTLRVLTSDVKIYNIDVMNTFGVAKSNGQAIALSLQATRVGVYASRLFSYQDTLYTNKGSHVFLKSYIEGAVDFIFGRQSQAYFEGNTIASKGAGAVTASGREANDTGIYLFNSNTLIAASDAFTNVTGKSFLGRPWGDFAKVVFKNTIINTPLNKTVWSIWSTSMPNTDDVLFGEFNSTGPGVSGVTRPSFSTLLTSDQASQYTISSAIGSNYTTWVDTSYLS